MTRIKKIKRFTFLCVCLIFCALLTVGCGRLVVAVDSDLAPYSYRTSKKLAIADGYAGIDIAIAQEIAKELDKKLVIRDIGRIVPKENEARTDTVNELVISKADFAVAGVVINDSKRAKVLFSIPYMTTYQVIVVDNNNHSVNSAEDIKPLTAAVVSGLTGFDACLKIGVENTRMYNSIQEALSAVKNGFADVAVIDRHIALSAVRESNEDYKIIEDSVFDVEEIAIAVKKDNFVLVEKINKVLRGLIEDGQIERWINKLTD